MAKPTVLQLVKAKKITPQQGLVLSYMRRNPGPICNRVLAHYAGLPINVITPRVYELRQRLYIHKAGHVYDRDTRRTVTTWIAS